MKRFYVAESRLTDGYCVFDKEKKYAFSPRPRKADCLNDAHILNKLHEENKQIKDLIHTMLNQIDAENITSDSAIYSAKIIFSGNEFNLIREIWKMTV